MKYYNFSIDGGLTFRSIKYLIVMKLIVLFVLLSLFQVRAESYAQTVSLFKENVSIVDVFREIKKQTNYNLICTSQIIEETPLISIVVKNASLDDALNQLLKPNGLSYVIEDNSIIVKRALKLSEFTNSNNTHLRQNTVTGTVKDADGEPLIGVSIRVKGKTDGTTTNENGQFSIALQQGETLVFNYIGFITTEYVYSGQGSINIILDEDVTGLEEVVVVGYGTQRKETLTGSVTSIKSEDITTTKSENLINNIQGKMPGLLIRQNTAEPGTFDNMVSIRGFGAPLVVIDGVPRDGTADLAQLNPDDVESISVLKDAAAAIYGMNSANGVIIVTTKKGVSGKARFSYSGLFGTKAATGMEHTIDAYSYRLMRNEMDKNIGNAPYYSDEILEKYRVGEPGYEDTDWIDLTLHDRVFQQQHSLSLRGGSDNVKYFTSFNYTEDNGLLKSDIQKYRRYNFRANTSADLREDLTLNVSFSGRLDNTQSPRNDFLWVFKPIMVNDRGQNYHTIANENHMTALPPENTNPFAMMSEDIDGYRRNSERQYQTTVDLTYTVPFIKGLKASVLGAYDVNSENNSMLQRAYDLYDYYTDTRTSTTGTDQYSNTMSSYNKIYLRGLLDYKRTFAEVHNLSLMGAAEMTRTRYDELRGSRQFSDIYTHDIIDQGTSTTATNGGFRNYGALGAYFSRINYDYSGKYLLEAVARYDGSYRYAPSKRWAFFPSMSIGWRISEEPFIKNNLKFLSEFKLRASYGESGRDVGNAFQYIAGYNGSSSSGYVFTPNELTIGMVAPGVVNDNLSWISSKTTNLGVDFGFFNGKLSGTIDVFERKNTGLLATRIQSLPNTFGASFPQENINSEMNRGIEFSITHTGRIGQEFSYFVGANTTYSRLKQLHVERAPFTSSWDRWKNGNENRYTGRLWQYEYDGRYTSLEQYETAPLMGGNQGNSKMLPGSFALVDLNGDGIINGNDQSPDSWTFGQVNPPLQYGMTLGGSYKTFDLNILLQGAALYSINYRNNDIWGYGRYPSLHEKYLDRWHTVNPDDNPYDPATKWIPGYYPALRTNTDNTTDGQRIDVWTPPATYLRLKSVELGYSLPKHLIESLKLSSFRVFANGFNLLTFSRRELKQADPERQEKDWDANLTYPLMKSFNIGINVNF